MSNNPHNCKLCRNGKELYGPDPEYINAINRMQKLWTAGHYPEYETMTLDEMVLRAGGPMSRIHRFTLKTY